MSTQLQNNFKVNGESCSFQVDTSPVEHSTNPISSGFVYSWYEAISAFFGKQVESSAPRVNSSNIPTVDSVYRAVVYATRNVIKQSVSGLEIRPGSLSSDSLYYYPDLKKLVYKDSDGAIVDYAPLKSILYYHIADNKLKRWAGSSFTDITLS